MAGVKRRTPKSSKHVHVHAMRRAHERYGLNLSKEDIDRMVQDIRKRRATMVAKLSRTRTVWNVEHDGQTLKAVYQRGMGILTFLSPDMITEAEKEYDF